ncbi:MAG: DUF4139 domain-containing protein [Alphaproteobacteria bacterium]|nr:DUF4139 domain-containing protein [Alphaproteobacteria bacterium]MBR1757035.1 DUF4139 domain-containing protein [Alphaproteobacteria bacterium]
MRLGLYLAAFTAIAGLANAEPLLLKNKGNSVSLSIYNQNLALVKDIRPAALQTGNNEIVFDGVASEIQAETAIIYGDGIDVSEQNYSYDLMSYDNFIDHSLGQEVTAVRTNPATGENIYETATLIGSANGRPILRFSYGIDSNYPGRVVFNYVPAGMSNQPTLTARLKSRDSGNRNLYLAYLTNGLSWKTDYVANVRSKTTLDLTGWVTITNNSGIDYNQAKIQLIAGDVNIVRPVMTRSYAAKGMRLMAMNAVAEEAADSFDGGIVPESINSYELYTLPNMTTIKDKQNKQIALIEKNDVKYEREFNLNTPIYFGSYSQNEFEKLHPQITYVIKNVTDSNLGISLPAGTVRFYENDKSGNLQFIGSNNINNTAKEDTLRLNLGDAFNISVSGKVKQIKEKELSRKPNNQCYNIKTLKTYEIEVMINNAEDSENKVIISQNFPQDYKIIKENFKSIEKNATLRKWEIMTKPNDKTKLEYTVDVTFSNRLCE